MTNLNLPSAYACVVGVPNTGTTADGLPVLQPTQTINPNIWGLQDQPTPATPLLTSIMQDMEAHNP